MNTVIIVSLILIAVFLIATFLFFKKATRIRKSISKNIEEGRTESPETLEESWQGIFLHLSSANESDWKLAIIEADKLIDDLLREKNFKGESMAEKLTSITKEKLPSIELLWEAHKLRNRIVHESGFRLDYKEAKKAVSYYEEALRDLKDLNSL